jgi:spermidine synthase
MKNKALLLGFFSTGSQVLLLRSVIAAFGGNELLIGFALGGWIAAVAGGAWWTGRKRRQVRVEMLFVISALLLAPAVGLIRLTPLLSAGLATEMVGIITAATLATTVMIPGGILCGVLFALIAREGWKPSQAVADVYVFEGLGAFGGGLTVTLLAGTLFSNLGMALALAVMTLAWMGICCRPVSTRRLTVITIVTAVSIGAVAPGGRWLDRMIDGVRFEPMIVLASLDTPYSHQTLLTQENTVALATDNQIETVRPDTAAAEETLVPILLAHPMAHDILWFGRPEFNLADLAGDFPELNVTTVDPRSSLRHLIDQHVDFDGEVLRVDDDPVAFLASGEWPRHFDAISVTYGSTPSYYGSRLLSPRSLWLMKLALRRDGLLTVTTPYDSERYLSTESSAALGLIARTLETTFDHVWMWPGTQTTIFASDSIAPPPLDVILARVEQLDYSPRHVRPDYLSDRLGEMRLERVEKLVSSTGPIHTLERPLLLHRHLAWQNRMSDQGEWITRWLNARWVTYGTMGVVIVLLTAAVVIRSRRRQIVGAGLLVVTGMASLTLELLLLYLSGSMAGTLYAHLGVMVGVFMLGLAAGSWLARQTDGRGMARGGLVLMIAATVGLTLTWDTIAAPILLWYYLAFLFTMAVATGSLFVAGNYRLCGEAFEANTGLAYALELTGSAVAAVLVLTVWLPQFGADAIMMTVTGVLVLTLIATLLASRDN